MLWKKKKKKIGRFKDKNKRFNGFVPNPSTKLESLSEIDF